MKIYFLYFFLYIARTELNDIKFKIDDEFKYYIMKFNNRKYLEIHLRTMNGGRKGNLLYNVSWIPVEMIPS